MEISDALFVAKLATLTYSDCITCLGTVAVKTHFIFLKVTITSQIPYHYDARISYRVRVDKSYKYSKEVLV